MNRYFFTITAMLCSALMFGQTPPAPTNRPPVGPGLPIDDGIVILFIFSILLAFYKIYNRKKASI